jgi:hypothetical protein
MEIQSENPKSIWRLDLKTSNRFGNSIWKPQVDLEIIPKPPSHYLKILSENPELIWRPWIDFFNLKTLSRSEHPWVDPKIQSENSVWNDLKTSNLS